MLVWATATPARAQAFANLKSALVDYSQRDVEPRMACANLAGFKEKEITQLRTRVVPAAENVPAHCRVSGLLAPEIAFEVNLPERWNRRFYMIGNGGHAGEGPEPGARSWCTCTAGDSEPVPAGRSCTTAGRSPASTTSSS